MITALSIKNYALIDNLNVSFKQGLSIITGETGAGKSILLGALSLILGKRADLSVIKEGSKKCIVEGQFAIEKYGLEDFFASNDLDYEPHTIIRREILPSGKSRAFVNDTPTTLNVLAGLSEKLIDIHAQHETLALADANYQFLIVDALAKNNRLLDTYKSHYQQYINLKSELAHIVAQQQSADKQYDYHKYLLNELEEADFKPDEQQNLEEITEQLNNVEDIKNTLEQLLQMAEAEEVGVADMLRNMNVQLKRLATFGKDYQSLNERLKSLQIELEDILMDLNERHSNLNFSEDEIEQYNNRLQLLYNLQKKHGVKTVADLLDEQKKLQIKVLHVENADEIIGLKENEIADVEKHLNSIADSIRKNRKNAIPLLKKQLEQQLATLEMPNTSLKISIEKSNAFLSNGKDQLSFLIATNKGAAYKPLKKVASGGEMSRIMLAVKAILSNYTNLPTIIFDEIDTGVSGEVATKIAAVMAEMSKNLQVIAITHLPQIAAKGSYHFKVYKKDSGKTTSTEVKLLTKSERINELAEMLSGKEVVASAVKHAKQLLTQ